MKVAELNEKLSLIANLGVIVGIVFLAVELSQQNDAIQQSNRIAESTALADLSARGVEFFGAAVSDPNLADLFVKLTNGDDLTPRESTQATFLAGQLLHLWYSAEDYFNNGLIDEEAYSTFLAAPQDTMPQIPGLVPFMRAQFRLGTYQSRGESRMTNEIRAALNLNNTN